LPMIRRRLAPKSAPRRALRISKPAISTAGAAPAPRGEGEKGGGREAEKRGRDFAPGAEGAARRPGGDTRRGTDTAPPPFAPPPTSPASPPNPRPQPPPSKSPFPMPPPPPRPPPPWRDDEGGRPPPYKSGTPAGPAKHTIPTSHTACQFRATRVNRATW